MLAINSFSELNLVGPLMNGIRDAGYDVPTPIQKAAIPHLLLGSDLLGCAQTGTGKTAAFALPILNKLASNPRKLNPREVRALILTPTRELAVQIDESFRVYGKHLRLRHAVIFGGVKQFHQVKATKYGVDVLVATPGRLLDLIEQRHVDIRNLEVFVLDEADQMLDMGFIHSIRRILGMLPKERQSLFFSATMPPDIKKLADSMLTNPVQVQVAPVASTVDLIEQSVMYVDRAKKRDLLKHLLTNPALSRVIIFTRTKYGANQVSQVLSKAGIRSDAIHGNKTQGARQRALDAFKEGRLRVLVATDIASRGIDVDDISHVINFEVPNIPESYVHRIGRTARAGAAGIAISLCDAEERGYIRDIERLIKIQIPVNRDQPFHSDYASRDNQKPKDKGHSDKVRHFRGKKSKSRGHFENRSQNFRSSKSS